MRVLTWNLFHGRSLPPANRDLSGEFTALIAGWDWDVALLQEVPPWWPGVLGRAAEAQQRRVLTSRNSLLPVRRALATPHPEWMKSNGGGCNAILSRQGIVEHRRLRLRSRPERRVAQLARLEDWTCVTNFHGSAQVPLAEDELARLWEHSLAWSGSEPLVLGGDLNLRSPAGAEKTDVAHVGRRDVDHIFTRGMEAVEQAQLLDRRVELGRGGSMVELSDHLPLLVSVRSAPGEMR